MVTVSVQRAFSIRDSLEADSVLDKDVSRDGEHVDAATGEFVFWRVGDLAMWKLYGKNCKVRIIDTSHVDHVTIKIVDDACLSDATWIESFSVQTTKELSCGYPWLKPIHEFAIGKKAFMKPYGGMSEHLKPSGKTVEVSIVDVVDEDENGEWWEKGWDLIKVSGLPEGEPYLPRGDGWVMWNDERFVRDPNNNNKVVVW